MATKKKVEQTAEPSADIQHTVDDHPELKDIDVLRGLVHALVHRVEFLEQMLAQTPPVQMDEQAELTP